MEAARRILVVDGGEEFVPALRRLLVEAGYEVYLVAGGDPALVAAARFRPHLVLVDLSRPGAAGVETCRRLRATRIGQEPWVLGLTGQGQVRGRAVDAAGADVRVPKPLAASDLLSQIQDVLGRQTSGPVVHFADLTVRIAEREVDRAGRRIELTAKEWALLLQFLRHPRTVLSRDRLLLEAWGIGPESSNNLVDVYIGYLRQKLERGGAPRLIHTVYGAGFALREP